MEVEQKKDDESIDTSSSSSSSSKLTPEKTAQLGTPDQLDDRSLPSQANDLLLWMARFPVQSIHPRPTTSVSASS